MTESVTSSGLHDPEPSEPPFLPSHLDIAAADFSHTATSQPDFASILSPVLASSSVHVSRQPSQSSFGASLFKASAHISASERQRSADLSQVSLGSYERSPIPYIPPTVSLAAPPGESDADYPNRTESPRLPPAASDPGLAGLAQAFASSAGSPPSYGPALLRQAPPTLSVTAYSHLLQAVLLRWAPAGPSDFQQRLRLCQNLQHLLQIPDSTHDEAVAAALIINTRIVPNLQSRLQALQAAKEAAAGPDAPARAPPRPYQQLILGPEQFAGDGVGPGAYGAWLQGEAERVHRHIALQQGLPEVVIVRVEQLSAKGLRARLRRRGKLARLLACAAPQATVQLDALFLKVWVAGNGTATADKQVTYTQDVDASGEAARGRAEWPGQQHEFTASSAAVMLCFELRNLRDRTDAGRSQLGKAGSRNVFSSLGSVAVTLADLEEAGPGAHRCKVRLLETSRSSTSVPASEPRPSITDALPSSTPDVPSSPRGLGASRKAGRRRIVGTLEFVFQMLVDKRGTGPGGRPANGTQGVPPAAATGFPSLDDGAESSGFQGPDPVAMTPRIRKSAQSTPRHSSAACMSGTGKLGASAGTAAGGVEPPAVPDSRRIFQRSRRSLRGSFRRRGPPPPKPPPGLLTPEAASAVLTEVFQHLQEAVKRQAVTGVTAVDGDAGGGKHAKHAQEDGTVSIESSLQGSLQTIAGLLAPGKPTDAVMLLCSKPTPQVLPPWALTLMALLAVTLHIRPPQLLLLVAAAASTCPPLSATDSAFPGRLRAFTVAAKPLAAARRGGSLTTGEAAALCRAAAPLLSEAAWALDRLHGAVLAQHAEHAGAVLRALIMAVSLVAEGGDEGLARLCAPHLREAVDRRMLPHLDLHTVTSRFDAVPVLVEALGSILYDLPKEAAVAAELPPELQIVEVSARIRYSMVTACLERLWGTEEQPGGDDDGGEVLYDGLLQQLEARLLRLHRLMLDLDVSRLPPAGLQRQPGPRPLGNVTYLPFEGIPLVDVPHLLAPAMLSWITVVGVKLETVTASYVAADAQAPPPHAWAPVSRVQGFLCSASLVDTFHAVGTSVDVIAARAIVAQPRAIAVRAAEALAAATGGAVRVCAAATEAAALADLRPAAQAAAAAGCLPPSGRALLSAHVDSIPADGGPAAVQLADGPAAPEGEVAWPPIICREIAVKLNNLTDAAVRMGGLDHQLAAHLARCGDPLLRGDTSPVAPPPPSAAVVSERLRLHGTSGRSLQASVQALDDTADDLSFMSDAFDGARSQAAPFAEVDRLPAAVQNVLVEAADTVRRSRLTVLTAIKHAFSGMFTFEIIKALERQSRGSVKAAPEDESLLAAAESAGGDGQRVKSMLKSVAASVTWGRGKAEAVDGGHEGRAAQAMAADTGLHSGALEALLAIINREFQVMKEALLPVLFIEVQAVLWQAAVDSMEALLLASAPGQSPLSFAQAYALRAAHLVLRDHFHAAGAGLPLERLDNTSRRVLSLLQLFMGPTAALTALAEVGGAAAAAPEEPRSDAGPVVAQVDVLRLLQQRAGDAEASSTLQELARRAVMKPMQVLFALPPAEDVVQRVDCRLVDHGVQGTLFLAASHLCFSSLAPLAATAAAVAPGGSFSLKRNSLFAAGSGAHPNVTLVAPLSKVRSMAQGFAKRSKSLVFTLDDNSQVEVANFRSAQTRGMFEEAVRLHVLGSNSALDRQLRGVATLGVTPAALRLPPGEAVLRSYACALYSLLLRNHRGALHVCRSLLLFTGSEDAHRTVVRFQDIVGVELVKGHWRGGLYVVVTASQPPHKVEFCEMPEMQAEELAAEVLGRLATAGVGSVPGPERG